MCLLRSLLRWCKRRGKRKHRHKQVLVPAAIVLTRVEPEAHPMTPQTVRAVLAYLMTGSLLVCLFLIAFKDDLTTLQAATLGTIIGAIIANSKVPLAYFFDGVAIAEQSVSTASAPAPDGTAIAKTTGAEQP